MCAITSPIIWPPSKASQPEPSVPAPRNRNQRYSPRPSPHLSPLEKFVRDRMSALHSHPAVCADGPVGVTCPLPRGRVGGGVLAVKVGVWGVPRWPSVPRWPRRAKIPTICKSKQRRQLGWKCAKVAKAATLSQRPRFHNSMLAAWKHSRKISPALFRRGVIVFLLFTFGLGWHVRRRGGAGWSGNSGWHATEARGWRGALARSAAADPPPGRTWTAGDAALWPGRHGRGGVVWPATAIFGGLVLSRKRHPALDPP